MVFDDRANSWMDREWESTGACQIADICGKPDHFVEIYAPHRIKKLVNDKEEEKNKWDGPNGWQFEDKW